MPTTTMPTMGRSSQCTNLLCGALLLVGSINVIARGGSDFRQALQPRTFQFPRDHGRHDGFKIEWWYFTGNLADSAGRSFGYQVTFFRAAMTARPTSRPSAWAAKDLYFAHAALTDVAGKRYVYRDRIERGANGLACASPDSLRVWLLDWHAIQLKDSIDLSTNDDAFAISLSCGNGRGPFPEGPGGINRKGDGPGQASYYYSMTRLPTRGRIRIGTDTFDVTGKSWMDHEFSSDSLGSDEVGWDWMGLQLKDGSDLMLYRLRAADGSTKYVSGTRVNSDGTPVYLTRNDVILSPSDPWRSLRSGAKYPLQWTVKCAGLQPIVVRSMLEDQELTTHDSTDVTYYEGAANVTDLAGKSLGLGYLEMTGYAKSVNGSR